MLTNIQHVAKFHGQTFFKNTHAQNVPGCLKNVILEELGKSITAATGYMKILLYNMQFICPQLSHHYA
jgi:hypothetical protein